jgi:DNA polymerase-3 subunit delta'
MAIDLPSWLESPRRRASAAIEADRFAHAVLVQGPPGWGQAELARAIALELLGRSAMKNPNDMADLAHPDLRWVLPEGKGEQIRIDTVRALGEFASQTPQIANCKVAVLVPADALNEHAANALLKTLEEPPGSTYLLLVTESASNLLPTIRSRCQRLDVVPASRADVSAWVASETRVEASPRVDDLAFELGFAPYPLAAAVREGAPTIRSTLDDAISGTAPIALAERLSGLALDDVLARSMRYLANALASRVADAAPRLPLRLGAVGIERALDLWTWHVDARAATDAGSYPNPRLVIERLLYGWRGLAA